MSILQKAYEPESFKKNGEQMVELLYQHLQNVLGSKQEKVINWEKPNTEFLFWKAHLKSANPESLFKTILAHSIHIHHPQYIGHQVCPPLPLTTVSSMLTSMLNNGSAVYEMGMASSALEKLIIEELSTTIGYNEHEAGGILTSGGTLANLTALLTARQVAAKQDIWKNGSEQKLGIMVWRMLQ